MTTRPSRAIQRHIFFLRQWESATTKPIKSILQKEETLGPWLSFEEVMRRIHKIRAAHAKRGRFLDYCSYDVHATR